MELKAKLIQLLPLQTGTGKNGEWKKQDIIVETEGQYPKKVCISIWGDKINTAQLQIGKILSFLLTWKAANTMAAGTPMSRPGRSMRLVQLKPVAAKHTMTINSPAAKKTCLFKLL